MLVSEYDRSVIFRSYGDIGATKPVGYLPLQTVQEHLREDVAALMREFEMRGLRARLFSEDQCCIKSGALYIYDPKALQRILDATHDILENNNWPLGADDFVKQIAKTWVEPTHPVYRVIQRAFGDE